MTAGTVDLNAESGIGNTTQLELAASTITADTTNGNIDLDNALATTATYTTLTTGTGTITVDNSGGGAAVFTTATTTDGLIDLENTAGDLTVGTAVTAGGTANVTLTTTTSGNVILTGTTTATGDTVTVNSAGAINGAGLVTGATVDLNAVSGIGNTTALNLSAGTITADTTNGNIDLNNAIAATYTTVTTGTGTITVDNTGAADFTTVTTGNGLVDLEAISGNLTVGTAVTAGGTANVTLTTTTSGNVILTGTTTAAGDTVTVNSAGAINGAGLVTGATVDLNAVSGIGNTTALNLSAGAITADTTNGNIDLNNAIAATYTTVTTGTGTITVDNTGAADFTTVTTGNGLVDLEAISGNLTVGTAVTAGGANNITLTTTTSGNVILTGTTTAAGDTVTVNSAGAINGAGLVTGATVDLNAASGIGNTTQLELAASTITADTTNGNIDLDNALATTATYTTLTTGTGTITVDNSGGGAAVFTTATTTNGLIDLENTAGDLTVGTAVTAGGAANVTLTTTTSGNVILTGTTTAAGDTVTVNSAGAINGAGLVTGATVDLNAVSGIGNTTALNLSAGAITADTTNGNIDLNNAIAATYTTVTTGTGTITVDNTGAAVFTTVTTGNGLVDLEAISGNLTATSVTAGGAGNDVALTTTSSGNIILGVVTAPDVVSLTAAGAVTDTNAAAANVVATSLTANTATGIDTDTTITTLTSAAVSGTGNIDISDTAGGMAVTSATTAAGNISLNATGGDLAVTTVTAAGAGNDVTLSTTTSGNITLGVVTAPDAVTLTAAGAVTDTNGAANNVSATLLTATAATGVDLDTSIGVLDASVTGTGNITIDEINAVQLGNGTGGVDTAAGNVTIVAGGAITTGNTIVAGGNLALTTTAGGVTLDNNLTTTGGGTVTVTNAGLLTLNANITAGGAVTQNGAGAVTITGSRTISTSSDAVDFLRAVTLSGSGALVAINTATSGTGGNIIFQSTLSATTAGANAEDLTLTAGTAGSVTFTGIVGGTRLGDVLIASANNVTESAGLTATTLTQSAGSGTTTLNGAVNTTGNVSLTGTNLAANNSITTTTNGAVTMAQSGTVTLAAAGDINSDGAVSLTATGGISTAGDVTTTNDGVTYVSATTLTGPVAINAGSGPITFTNTVNGAQALNANSTGLTTFNQVVGGTTALTTLTTNAGGTTAINANVTTSGTQTYADSVRIDATAVTLTSTAGSTSFGGTIDGLTAGVNNLTINTLAGATTIAGPIGGTVPLASLTINTGAALVLPSTTTTGTLTVAAAGAITNTPTAQINIGGLATLGAGSNAITLGTNAGSDTANFGSLTVNGGNVAIAEDSATTLVGTSTATSLTLTSTGATSFTGTTTVTGNLNNTAGATATYSGTTTVGGNMSSTAAGATLLNGTTSVTGDMTITSTAGTISDVVGASLTVGGVGTLLAGSLPASTFDITLNNTVLSGASNFGSIAFIGNNVTLVETGSAMNVSGTATGHLALTALLGMNMDAPGVNAASLAALSLGGDITDSGPTVVRPGLSTFDASGFDIILDHPGNDFAQVLLAGQAVTLFDQNAINVVGVAAGATLNLTAGGLVSVDIPMNVALSVSLTSTGDNVVINAPITIQPQGGTLRITAANDVSGVAAGTLTTSGGAITVTAGSNVSLAGAINTNGGDLSVTSSNNVQLAGIATAGGSLTVNAGSATSGGGARFTTGVDVSGAYTANAGTGGVTFDSTVNGSGSVGTLTVNTTGDTRFSGAIGNSSPFKSLVTNAGGTTILAGGSMQMADSFNFKDPVELAANAANTTITAARGTFDGAVRGSNDGGQSLTLAVSGNLVFNGAVGDAGRRLASLTTGSNGDTLIYGGSVNTLLGQTYNNRVQLGKTTLFTASNLTFNGTVVAGPQVAPALPLLVNDSIIGFASPASDNPGIKTNVTGITAFNNVVGTPGAAPGIGDVRLNVDDAGVALNQNSTVVIRGISFNAASITSGASTTFEGAVTSVATTGTQDFMKSVTLGTDLVFSSSYAEASAVREGITFRGAITRPSTDNNRKLEVSATSATIQTGGDIGSETDRFASVSLKGRNINIGADIWTTNDIRLEIGTRTGDATTANDRISFNPLDPTLATPVTNIQRHTRLDSESGEIVLGSGAIPGDSAKTDAPARASIFKSNDASDLYLFAHKVTIQPFERLAVRDGSLIVIADGTDPDDGISIGSAAASNYLVLTSAVPSTAGGDAASIRLQAREPSNNFAGGNGTLVPDLGTELIAGKVVFFGAGSHLPNSNIPTRTRFKPDSGNASESADGFNYFNSYKDTNPDNGNLVEGLLSDVVAVLRPADSGLEVKIADLATQNSSRNTMPGILYLDLTTANSSPSMDQDTFIASTFFGDVETLSVSGVAQRTIPTFQADSRNNLPTVSTNSVPREELAATPTETDLAAAVREQLQALGIYARGLTEEEKAARRGKIVATFVAVPARVRPVESDYLVVEARVEDRAVREVIQNALDTGLIGEGQTKLEEVAKALGDTYEAFTKANPGASEKSADVLVGEYRDWLLHSQGPEAQTVISYMKALRATLKKIELLGLTRQELEGSKAQIYGSVLRARLNVEPEFLRKLVEGAAEDVWAARQEPPIPSNKQASNASMAAGDGLALY